MRITVDKLLSLIKSLSKSEKRYFKLFVSGKSNTKEKHYLQLFDFLDKKKDFNKSVYQKNFKHIKNLGAVQKYLYQMLIKSLQMQLDLKSVDLELMDGLKEVEILYQKELLNLVKEKVEQLQIIAEEYQKIFFLPLIYEWKMRLSMTHFGFQNMPLDDFESIHKSYTNSPQLLQEYIDIRSKMSRFVFEGPQNFRRKIDSATNIFVSTNIEVELEQYSSYLAKLAYLQFGAFYGAFSIQPNLAYAYHLATYRYMNTLPSKIQADNHKIYFSALMGSITYTKDFSFLQQLLDEAEMLLKNKPETFSLQFQFMIKLKRYLFLLRSQKFEEALAFALLIDVDSYNIKNNMHFAFYYHLTLNLFALEDYEKALETLNTFLFDKEKSTSKYDITWSLLRLIILYELNETDLLFSLLNNIQRSLKRKGNLLAFEKMFIAFLKKLINLPAKEREPLFVEFKNQLVLFLDQSSDEENEVLSLFNYMEWLDKHIEKRPFKQIRVWHTA